MKAIKLFALFGILFLSDNAIAQEKNEVDFADSTGLPGDNFSLQAALEMFKNSKSLEDFEKRLNSKDNGVNNLDLNGDSKIDYIKVIDYPKENSHAIALQVPVSKTESQDIAVIEIEKDGDKSAFLQIVGDEDIYGESTIVEPAETPEPADNGNSEHGPSSYSMSQVGVYVNVWFWPCVPVIYAPTYVVWVSPWYWGYYPMWWSPWPPYPWRYYHMHTWHYHNHYHYYPYHRSAYAHQIYAPRRHASVQVHNTYKAPRDAYKANVNNKPRPGRPSSINTNTRPSTKPAARPDSRPTTKPGKQPGYHPASQPTTRPQTKPSTQPKATSRPQTKPSTQPKSTSRPQTKPAPKQQTKPSSHPGSRQPSHQQSRPPQNRQSASPQKQHK